MIQLKLAETETVLVVMKKKTSIFTIPSRINKVYKQDRQAYKINSSISNGS
ncbi:MAG: hypothetical protein JXR26_01285 [Balneolaceae bacterium]|nr:hypothetical protein [Balneolaceae bacterium]